MERFDTIEAEIPLSEDIIERNLQKMRRDMIELLGNESIGGNAGWVMIEGRRCQCAGANGVIVQDTGEIKTFSNHDFPDGINEAGFILKIAYDGDETPIVSWSAPAIQEHARRVLQECVERWNTENRILWRKEGDQ